MIKEAGDCPFKKMLYLNLNREIGSIVFDWETGHVNSPS